MAKSKKLTEEQLKARYPHMVEGTLTYDEIHQKQRCKATCANCGDQFSVFTSDLFQLTMCKTCRAEARKARRRKGKGKLTINTNDLNEEQRAALIAAGVKLPEPAEPVEEEVA